jgi:methionine-S-sulfoxide reductase
MAEPKTAIFAAGCFWKPEYEFRQHTGVIDTQVGYTGGHVDYPDYETVCAGNSGHAEAVRIIYDPDQIGYRDLLAIFFRLHDPRQKNRQGLDIGHQYRSAIFYMDEEQRKQARHTIDALLEQGYAIQTELNPAETFWPAEKYHQCYLEKHKQDGFLS